MTRTIPPEALAGSIETWIGEIEEAAATLPHSAGLEHVLAGMRQALAAIRARSDHDPPNV